MQRAKGAENRCVSQLQVVVGKAGCGTGGPNRDGAGMGREPLPGGG